MPPSFTPKLSLFHVPLLVIASVPRASTNTSHSVDLSPPSTCFQSITTAGRILSFLHPADIYWAPVMSQVLLLASGELDKLAPSSPGVDVREKTTNKYTHN
jgi:hypothetical protein